jgi:hypothetical protein
LPLPQGERITQYSTSSRRGNAAQVLIAVLAKAQALSPTGQNKSLGGRDYKHAEQSRRSSSTPLLCARATTALLPSSRGSNATQVPIVTLAKALALSLTRAGIMLGGNNCKHIRQSRLSSFTSLLL